MRRGCGVHPVRMGFCPQKTVKMHRHPHLGFPLPQKPDQSPQASSTRDSKGPSMGVFAFGTISGYRRVTQATNSLGVQEQGGLAEMGMETHHPSS